MIKFPRITHIENILHHIENRPEFIVAHREHYSVVNYVCATSETFLWAEDPTISQEEAHHRSILRECRGLLFYPDGRIMSRRLHKFKNINEAPETQFHEIDFTQPHVILEKLDGSMITPIMTDAGIRWGTKMGLTEVGMGAEEFVAAHPNYDLMARWCINRNLTPIFEWCSRKQRIVVDYPEDRLVLTAIRENETGEYLTHRILNLYGQEYNIDVVKAYEGTAENMTQLMEETKGAEGIEGWVIRFDDGHMLKVKGEWYVRIHKTKDILTQEKNVIDLIVNEAMDDAKAFMMEEDRKRVEEFEHKFWYEVNLTIQILEVTVKSITQYQTRKEFALNDYDMYPTHRAVVFACWDGSKSVRDEVLKVIKKNLGSQTKVNGIRHLFGGLEWERNS